ncbi:transposase [Sorangium sp. So ce269]
MHVEPTEKNLTGVAGLAPFGAFLRELGVDAALSRRFSRLKTGRSVIYPMAAQMRLLMDSALAGEERVFGIEALAVDPLFVHLAGGIVPSIDTVYRDLCRFDEDALEVRIPVDPATHSAHTRPPIPDPATPSQEPRRRHPSPVATHSRPGARRPGQGRGAASVASEPLDADEHSRTITCGTPGGRPASESVAASVRNRWPPPSGIGGRMASEYALEALHSMVVDHGLALVARRKHRFVHIDVDTTVEPLFGRQEGALPGPNPRYHGRPSYHPILARVAEVDAIVGAKLRPGDTSFGEADVPFVEECIERARTAAPSAAIYVRIDGAGDCSALMHAVATKGCFFLTKARMSADLVGKVAHATGWRTIDRDADGRPRRQVVEVPFRRTDWPDGVRVIAVRTRDRENGKQIYLWEGLDYTVQVFLTNEPVEAPVVDHCGTPRNDEL